ncbi:hypothetical protein [Saccharothrix yanglingensis]|uniref:Integral membrane protein n=1 Tax=Saccharothrix yanglingensis TaxID=659496 RepID=A0ABU0WS66_9PSEU|nr:hypothetical protein [Saccharothrix yanglingensis]MDQ2582688.1 hypothetical protein [Saccharothrix yanglingensis]
MTQPPFDPYGTPMRPVNQPQAGPLPGYPGQMRGVDQFTTALVRPGAVLVAFVFWVLASLSWPVGTVVRFTAEEGGLVSTGSVLTLFGTGCLAIGGVLGSVAFVRGGYHARLALCGGAFVIGILAVAAVVVAAREGLEPASWVVVVLRLLLPAVAAVFSFLPGTRHYFAGNLG